KKKTRRGSRGGRGRKKPAAAAGADQASDNGTEPAAVVDRTDEPVKAPPKPRRKPTGPRIHVPDETLGRDGAGEAEELVTDAVSENGAEAPSEDGDEASKPKKRTRRGSRGGRNRKKKPAGATAENGSESTPGRDTEPNLEPEPEPVAAAPSQTEDTATSSGDWEYVPMSQWDDDDK
ncbi:MAG: hypothetical protein M3540_06105, partial [Actinomycetota bacterium]|nr:hypothetical protein [Actinomycetota bacterium]